MHRPETHISLFEKIQRDTTWVIHIHCCAVSDILRKSDDISEKTRAHIIRWFLHPDIWSPFDRKTRLFRNRIPKKCIIPLMQWLWYDGLIALCEEEIIWHAFIQKHKKKTGDELHLFSIAVATELQRRGIGTKIGQTFVEFGRDPQKHITRLRMWGGGDDTVKAIFRKIESESDERAISTSSDFFITFNDRVVRLVDTAIPPKLHQN